MAEEKIDMEAPPLSRTASSAHTASVPSVPVSRRRRDFTENTFPFAGRIGGNQEFTLDREDPNRRDILKKIPDAAPFCTWRESFDFNQLGQLDLWKAAVLEGWGTLMITYLSVITAVGLTPVISELSTGPLVPAIIGAITNAMILPLFIYAAGPVSGGHMNPTISIATFVTRLSTFPRSILYIAFQVGGAGLAGLLLRSSLGSRNWVAAGCFMDTSQISVSDAFSIEFTVDMVLVFLAFGVGLDPRQRAVFGPALGPIFVGIILGLCGFGSAMVRPGYSGISANPARCFGAMAGSHFQSYHWIHWVGPTLASIANGVFYKLIPPYFHFKSLENVSN